MITTDELRAYYRFETGPELFSENDCAIAGPCYVSVEDADAALANMQTKKTTAREFAAWNENMEWNYEVQRNLLYCSEKEMKKLDFDGTWQSSDRTEADLLLAIRRIYRQVEDAVEEEGLDGAYTDFLDYRRMRNDIATFLTGEGAEIDPEAWSPVGRRSWMLNLSEEALEVADAETLEAHRAQLEFWCDKGDVRALEKRAYCQYGGNSGYECDWTAARDTLLSLMQSDKVPDRTKCFFANSLGYIYYYGRCTAGEPDYGNALRFFTLGLAGGIYESAYKLADMFAQAKGVPESEEAASNLTGWVYCRCLPDFLDGWGQSKYADAALRMGRHERKRAESDPEYADDHNWRAYELFMQAELALRMRAEQGGSYGDDVVADSIRTELEEMRKIEPDAEACKYVKALLPLSTGALFDGKRTVKIRMKRTKKGITIKAKRRSSFDDAAPRYAIVTYPTYGYCKLIDHATEKARDVSQVRVNGHKGKLRVGDSVSFIADTMSFDSATRSDKGYSVEFYRRGKMVASITAKLYLYEVNWTGC